MFGNPTILDIDHLKADHIINWLSKNQTILDINNSINRQFWDNNTYVKAGAELGQA